MKAKKVIPLTLGTLHGQENRPHVPCEEFPEVKDKYPEAWERSRELLDEQQELMAGLLRRNQFAAADISWRSFPDNAGHRN